METTAALLTGLAAGLAIAMQVGAVSLLLVETAVIRGARVGIAAGMGVASVDFAFAVVAAATGGAAGAALKGSETEIRVAAALVLAAIAVHGLLGLRTDGSRSASAAAPADATASTRRGGEPSARAHYARFLVITAANPLTIASFAAVAAALALDGVLAAAAFAVGVGASSAAWHLLLTAAAGHAARWITPGVRRTLAVVGRLTVLAIAAHLALA
jgi:threonine/homoserine/homoserine lactone efflux protein